MKIACVYHVIDLDGWMSAAIVKYWFELNHSSDEDTIDYIGHNYNQKTPDLSQYDKVIICDITLPKDDMLELANRLGINLIWIDHHQPVIDTVNPYIMDNAISPIEGLITEEGELKSACELTWEYFFPNEEAPEIVTMIGAYDSFRHKGTEDEKEVMEYQYAYRNAITNVEQAYYYLQCYLQNDKAVTDAIPLDGAAIYDWVCTEAQQIYKQGFPIILPVGEGLDDIKCVCINRERFNPANFGIDYTKDDYQAAVCFHRANGKWNFSIYTEDEDISCSLVANIFGGGGHRGAAGFMIDDIENFLHRYEL
jgi:oligoribonuclease NrnB/cAMP/cGMP phosphodiesterase (DHH superfamily)